MKDWGESSYRLWSP